MRRPLPIGLLLVCVLAAGCGGGGGGSDATARPDLGVKGTRPKAAEDLGFPGLATKNTTRIGGANPVADAAAVARAVYSGSSRVTRPRAVVLADVADWRSAVAASVFMSAPLRAPLLFSREGDLPAATRDALEALAPTGAREVAGAQLLRIGDAPEVAGLETTDVRGRDPFAIARAVDALQAAARGAAGDRVLVVSADDPAYAMPAAGWAAKSGDPVLFTHRDSLPPDTRAAIASHQRPQIYVLGGAAAVSESVVATLRGLGTVRRIAGRDAIGTAIAFARYVDGAFGWGIVDPGHGLVFANATRPADAAAAAPLSASGSYGPLLLLDDAGALPARLESFLLDIQPGYTRDPVRGVYNRGWIVGDERAVSVEVQSRIDSLLEIVPVNERGRPPATGAATTTTPTTRTGTTTAPTTTTTTTTATTTPTTKATP